MTLLLVVRSVCCEEGGAFAVGCEEGDDFVVGMG